MSWLSAAWHWYAHESVSQTGAVDHPNAALVNPIVASVGAALLIAAALLQAATARRRHKEQTDADRQRRITESFSKATEQLGNDKIEVRLGGIYTLERISRESPNDYWTVVETLTAFVRERARRNLQTEPVEKTKTHVELPKDIAAVLTVIVRRHEKNQWRESEMGWQLDFRGTDLSRAYLRRANLSGADLSRANLSGANLHEANLRWANLSEADLSGASLMGANLSRADFSRADLMGAYLNRADLRWANLSEADLSGANLMGANLSRADLSRAYLRGAILIGVNLSKAKAGPDVEQLGQAIGDASTQLPAGFERPARWPTPDETA
jgi:hypothetical protein